MIRFRGLQQIRWKPQAGQANNKASCQY